MKEIATIGIVALLTVIPAYPHGASRGLHLHVEPEPAAAGSTITLEIDAMEAMKSVTVGWVGGEKVAHKPDEPARHILVKMKVPEKVGQEVLNLHAEATTISGKQVRAAVVVRISGTATETQVSGTGTETRRPVESTNIPISQPNPHRKDPILSRSLYPVRDLGPAAIHSVEQWHDLRESWFQAALITLPIGQIENGPSS